MNLINISKNIFSQPRQFFLENLTIKQTILKNTFWLILSQIISKLFKLVLIIFAAKILGPSKFGAFNYLFSIAGFFFLFADWGITVLIVRDYQQKKDREKYIQAGFYLKILFAFISFIIALFGLFIFDNPEFKKAFVFIILLFFINNIKDYVVALFRAIQKMEKEFILFLIESLTSLIIGIIFLLIFKNIISLTVAYFLSGAISLLFSLILVLKYFKYSLKPIFNKEIIKYFIINGAPFIFFGLLSFVFFSTDQIILGKFRGVEEVGYYSLASKIIIFLTIIPSFFTTSIFPFLSSEVNNKEKIKKNFNLFITLFLSLGILISVLGIILAPIIIPVVFGAQYFLSIKIFQFLILIIIFLFPTLFLDCFLAACNKQWQNFIITSICAILNLVLNLFLIPVYGMFAAASVSIFSQILNFFLTYNLSKKFIK